MDGAEACYSCSAKGEHARVPKILLFVGGRGGSSKHTVVKPRRVSVGGTASSADLGGSSKYSNENFED